MSEETFATVSDKVSKLKQSVDSLSKDFSEINKLKKSVETVSETVADIDRKASQIERKIDSVQQDLLKLTQDFQQMVKEQKSATALQKAISELIRVRQEIGQKYGNYSLIRETMLGVIQATDAALVKKNTISQVSEELMLSTPEYWLSPCLVAVSAWISNDRNLAERAIAEAMKRDEEKTALAMALICRRNGRIETGFEWLSIYFSKQSAQSITEETFTYIDAYVNGVFGPDDRNMCQGYIAKWIDEIRGNRGDFETAQEEKWANYCQRFQIDVKSMYPDLAQTADEFSRINSAVGSVNSYGVIRKNFKGIKDAFVDQETMKKAIDSELVQLISNYDKAETDIRREEEYLSLVKYYEGDEEKAKREILSREIKRQQKKLDFIEKMSSEIIDETDAAPSKRRTAVTFLSSYINRGYSKYIDKAKNSFPDKITLKLDDWTGLSNDGTEFSELAADYERTMNLLREEEISTIEKKPRTFLLVSVVMFVLAVVCGITVPILIPASIGMTVVSIILFSMRFSELKTIEKRIARVNNDFDNRIAVGKAKLESSLSQWNDICIIMDQYNSEGEHIVA